jgi:hypothetical protein
VEREQVSTKNNPKLKKKTTTNVINAAHYDDTPKHYQTHA